MVATVLVIFALSYKLEHITMRLQLLFVGIILSTISYSQETKLEGKKAENQNNTTKREVRKASLKPAPEHLLKTVKTREEKVTPKKTK